MKILIVSESTLPRVISGVSVFTAQLTDQLVRHQHEVRIFTNSPKLRAIVTVHPHTKIYAFASLPNPFRKNLRFAVPTSRVRTVLEQERPDIIHCQDPGPLAKRTIREARALGIPIILTNHFTFIQLEHYFPAFLRRTLLRRVIKYLRALYRQADLITCPSEFVKQMLERAGIRTEIVVVSNGIDVKRFRKAPPPRFQTPTILSVGRIDPEKRIDILIRAAELVRQKLPKAKFIFIGGGNQLERYRALVRRRGLTEAINFIGPLRPEQRRLTQYYQRSWLFWLGSKAEAQGIVFMEAMAAGLPCLAHSEGGAREVIRPGITGYLLPRGSAREFADRAIQLLTDRARLRQLSQRCRVEADRFAINHTLAEFEKLYRLLVTRRLRT